MTDITGQYFDRYHILESLGEGGMASVYKAYDTRLDRDVAVKVIRTDMFGAAMLAQILKRFEREAKALARLTHPNIVNVIDYGEHVGTPYLVMEYLPGGSLKAKMGRPVPWQEALKLLLPVAEALEYAHNQNIVHRDIKPANILMTHSGQPMLTDFGIAKILDLEDGQTLTGTGVGIGTPEYMSPEQGLGKPVDARTDIYSLGVVLYELVTGRKPYTADTPMAVVVKHLNDPLLRPRQFVPDLPDRVEKIIIKTLAKKPEQRFASMAEITSAIETLLRGQTKIKQPTHVLEKLKEEIPSETEQAVSPKLGQPEDQIAPESRLPDKGKPAGPIFQETGPEKTTIASPETQAEPEKPPVSEAAPALPEEPAEKEIAAPLSVEGRPEEHILSTTESEKTTLVSPEVPPAAPETPPVLAAGPVIKETAARPVPARRASTKIQSVWIIALIGLVAVIALGVWGISRLKARPATIPTATATEMLSLPPTLASAATQAPTLTLASTPTLTTVPTLGVGLTWLRSADNMTMVSVPAGEFMMNSIRPSYEQAYTAYLDAFWIDKNEITNAMYAKCVGAGACQEPRCKSSTTRSSYYGNSQYDNFPVMCVDKNEAQSYCMWAGGRLPTEAEWEKAARGTDARIFPWGDIPFSCLLANWNGCYADTVAVGSYPSVASPYGALDMTGNVGEWVSDWYDPDSHANSPSSNPTGPVTGYPLYRGSDWRYGSGALMGGHLGSVGDVGHGMMDVGFRCVRDAK